MSVGSCEGLNGSGVTKCRDSAAASPPLVVTGVADIGARFTTRPRLPPWSSLATRIFADGTVCRSSLCSYTLNNTGPLNQRRHRVPEEGRNRREQKACVDYVSSMRSDGDLYLHLLFDARRPRQHVAISLANSGSGTLTTPSYLEGFAGLLCEPVCVGILVLTCDPGSNSEQESALVRDVG